MHITYIMPLVLVATSNKPTCDPFGQVGIEWVTLNANTDSFNFLKFKFQIVEALDRSA